VQDVPGTRDLEHHGGQPVAHEVVDVTGDPAPLDMQGLLREFGPGGLELGDDLGLTSGRAAENPREGDAENPDPRRDLGRILDHRRDHGSEQRQHAQRHGFGRPRGGSPDNEGEQGDLEQERLELPRPLRHHRRDDDRERQQEQRHAGHVGPHEQRGGREPAENEIGAG
jgi:hypothetical protein